MFALLKYFWLIVILAGVLSSVRSIVNAQPHIAVNSSLRKGYNKLILARFLLILFPMLIVGYGCMRQANTSMLDFFYPRKMNPVVLAFYAALIAECVLLYYWIFMKGGAKYLKKYPAIFSKKLASSKTVGQASAHKIKRAVTIQIVSFAVCMALVWIAPLPVIHF